MSEGKESNKQPNDYQSLPNSNGRIFPDALGSGYNFLMEKECLKNLDHYLETEELKCRSQVILFGVLTTLALLGLAALIQTPKIATMIQQAGINSVTAQELREKKEAEAFKEVVWEATATGLP